MPPTSVSAAAPPQRTLHQHCLRLAAALTTITVVGATAVSGASAASLGGLTLRTLFARTVVAAGNAPIVLSWENFNAANGTNIDGTTTDGGSDVWNAASCTWVVQANQADSNLGDCLLTVNPGRFAYSSEVTISRNGSTSFDAGLAVNSNAAGTQFLSIEYTWASNGSLQIWAYNGGYTNLVNVTNLYPAGIATAPSSIVLRVEAPLASPNPTSTIRAYINGVLIASYTLTAAQETLYRNNSHRLTGPYTYYDSTSTFDNFHVDQ